MKAQVKLVDIIDAQEFVSMDNRAFVNLNTGEVDSVPNDFLSMA